MGALVLIDGYHVLRPEHVRLMESSNALPFIRLGATPLRRGLGKHIADVARGVRGEVMGHGLDYNEAALGAAMNRKDLVGDIVRTWQEMGEDRPTLGFAMDIAHSKVIAPDFDAEGVTVADLNA